MAIKKAKQSLFDGILLDPDFAKYLKKQNKQIVSIEKKEPDKLHVPFREFFIQFYTAKKATPYAWSAKDASNLSSLIKKIRRLMGDNCSDEKYLEVWNRFLKKSIEVDQWISDNFSVSILNSKYNELVAKIQNKKSKQDRIQVRPIVGGGVIWIKREDFDDKFYKEV